MRNKKAWKLFCNVTRYWHTQLPKQTIPRQICIKQNCDRMFLGSFRKLPVFVTRVMYTCKDKEIIQNEDAKRKKSSHHTEEVRQGGKLFQTLFERISQILSDFKSKATKTLVPSNENDRPKVWDDRFHYLGQEFQRYGTNIPTV